MSDDVPGGAPPPDDPPDAADGADAEDGHPEAGFTDATHGRREVPGAEVTAHEHVLPHAGEHDYEPDVEQLHRAIYREPRDPVEGREPAPWWVWAAAALALFWGGWYLGRHGGVFGPETHLAFPEIRSPIAAEAAEQAETARLDPVGAGQQIYAARCQACHQQDGAGVSGVFPPLIGAEWVVGPAERLVLILLHGLQGPITVRGQPYDGVMPGWAEILSDAEIAAVATFVRQWQENEAPAVDPELVADLRARTADRQAPWTAPELQEAVP